MNNPILTLVGNMVDEPELRFTPSGAAVANFRIASTPRKFDRATNEWVDGETIFMSCSAWRQMAENVAESLEKGMRVVVTGKLKARSYETREGEKRTVFELDVEEVGPSLKYATATVTRRGRTDSGEDWSRRSTGAGPRDGGRESADPWRTRERPPAADDPWAAGSRGSGRGSSDPWGGNQSDEPPF